MKWLATSFLAVLFIITISVTGFSQADPSKVSDGGEKWIRVASDDGEFSVEVPEKYHYFFNDDGFSVSKNGQHYNYNLKQVRLFKSSLSGTIISFECYEGDKKALDVMLDSDSFTKAKVVKSEIKRANFSIKQMIRSTKQYYMICQYFYSKKHIYVLTTASRNGETVSMRRFLDSLIFSPNVRNGDRTDTVKLSSLSVSEPEIAFDLNAVYPPAKPQTKTISPKDIDEVPFKLLYKPHPSFTQSARESNVTGIVVVRATFSAQGHISKIIVLRQLPVGLLRQVLFAAIRMSFLPKEKNGKAESVTKHIEYSFAIY